MLDHFSFRELNFSGVASQRFDLVVKEELHGPVRMSFIYDVGDIVHQQPGVNQDYCLLRLLWLFGVRCQHKGFRFQVSGEIQPAGTIHFLRHTLPFSQLTASGVLAPGLSVPMFSLIHSTTDIDG